MKKLLILGVKKYRKLCVGVFIILLILIILGCSKNGEFLNESIVDSQTDEMAKKVIKNWAEYIDKQEYNKAFSLYLKKPSPEELEDISRIYSKSFKKFRLKDVKLDVEHLRVYKGDKDGNYLVYIASFETVFSEKNYTSYEDDPVRYIVLVKTDRQWKIVEMNTAM